MPLSEYKKSQIMNLLHETAGPLFDQAADEEGFLAAADVAYETVSAFADEQGYTPTEKDMAFDLLQDYMFQWEQFYQGVAPKPSKPGGALALLKRPVVMGIPLGILAIAAVGAWWYFKD